MLIKRDKRQRRRWDLFGHSSFDTALPVVDSDGIFGPLSVRFLTPDGDPGGGGGGDPENPDDDPTDKKESGDDPDNPVEDEPDEDDTIAKAEFVRVQKESIKRKEELKKRNKRIAELEASQLSEEDREAFDKWKAEQAQQDHDKRKKKGEYEQLLAEQKDKYEKQLSEANTNVESLRAELAETHVRHVLATTLPGLINEKVPVEDVTSLIIDNFRWDEDEKEVVVIDADDPDERAMGSDGGYMKVDEFIAKWLEKRPAYAAADKPTGSSGKSFRGTGPKGRTTRQDVGTMSQADFRKNRDKIKAAVGQ